MFDRWTSGLVRSAAAAALVFAAASAAGASDLLPADLADSAVAITNVRTDGQTVMGRVQNNTNTELRDVRVVVSQDFRWRREFHPGDDNPGQSEVVEMRQPIPPRGSADFTVALPLPEARRADGDFETSVKLVGFTQTEWRGTTY